MKRTAHIFLSAVLIFSLLLSMVSVGIAANLNELSWTIYNNGVTKIGTGSTLTGTTGAAVTTVTDKLYTGADGDGDGKAYYFNKEVYAQYAAAKVSLKKNTYYNLTAYYYCDALDGYAYGPEGVFSHVMLIKDGGTIATPADNLGYIDRNACYYNNEYGFKIDSSDRVNNSVTAGQWNKITFPVYSGNLDEALLTFRPAVSGYPVWIDNIQLTEVKTADGIDKFLGDFSIYDNFTNVLGSGGTATTTTAAAVNTASTAKLFTGTGADGDGKAIEFNLGCYAQWPTAKLGVKANTYYELSFYYYCKTLDAYQWGDDGVFSDVVIAKNGGGKTTEADHLYYIGRDKSYYIDATGAKVTSSARINSGIAADKWNKLTMRFYTGNNTDVVLAMRPSGNANPVYVDNIRLTDIVEQKVAIDWEMYDMGGTKIGAGGTLRAVDQYYISQDKNIIYTGIDGDGDGRSIAVQGGYAQFTTAKIAVTKNKNYKLTAYYKSSAYNASGVGILSHALIMKDGGANLLKGSDADVLSLINETVGGAYCKKDGVNNSPITNVSTKTNISITDWNKIELYFNSGELTSVLAAFRITNQNVPVYFDGISLTEVSVIPTDDQLLHDWKIYDNSTEKIGTGGLPTYTATAKAEIVTDMVYTGVDGDGDGKSVKVTDSYAQYATAKMSVVKNTNYKLSLYYYTTSFNTDNARIIDSAFVIKDGGTKPLNSDADTLSYIDAVVGNAYCKKAENVKAPITNTSLKTDIAINQWNKITFYFNSGSLEEALVSFRAVNNNPNVPIYYDGFKLEEVSAIPCDDQLLHDWKVYDMGSDKIGTNGTQRQDAKVEVVTDTIYTGADGDGDGKAYMLDKNTYAQYATLPIQVKKNTYYNLTFYYYGTQLGAEDSILGEVKVVKDGATNTEVGAENLGYLSRTSSYYTNRYSLPITKYDSVLLVNAEKNTWNKVEVPFYSGDLTEVLLSVRPVSYSAKDSTVGVPVYIDGLKLTKTTKNNFAYADTKPFEGWGGPRDVVEINFDDFYVPMDLSQRMQLVEGPAKEDGNVSIATHILEGSYSSATVPNLNTIGNDIDPVFTVPVLPSTKYSIKYSLYITEGQPALSYFGFYYDFFYTDGTEDTNTIVRNTGMPQRGEWVTFESFFTTKPDQTVCTLAWNAGHSNIDMYIDDIVLRKLQPGIAYDATDTSYSEDFYNILIDNYVIDDIKAAKSGVYKLPVKKDAFYTFGLNAGSSKKSNSRIFVSFDGVNPMVSGVDAPSSIITANGKMSRYGMSFITDYSGYVYIVIENDDNALKIEDPTLFFAYKLTKDENKGYLTDPNNPFEAYTGDLKELWVLGDSDEFFTGIAQGGSAQDTIEQETITESDTNSDSQTDNDFSTDSDTDINTDFEIDAETEDAESPETGSAPLWPVIAIIFTTLIALVVSMSLNKGGKRV